MEDRRDDRAAVHPRAVASSRFHTWDGDATYWRPPPAASRSRSTSADHHLNLQGLLHGGVIATLADTAAGLAVRGDRRRPPSRHGQARRAVPARRAGGTRDGSRDRGAQREVRRIRGGRGRPTNRGDRGEGEATVRWPTSGWPVGLVLASIEVMAGGNAVSAPCRPEQQPHVAGHLDLAGHERGDGESSAFARAAAVS